MGYAAARRRNRPWAPATTATMAAVSLRVANNETRNGPRFDWRTRSESGARIVLRLRRTDLNGCQRLRRDLRICCFCWPGRLCGHTSQVRSHTRESAL
jgi:hypothetical protein